MASVAWKNNGRRVSYMVIVIGREGDKQAHEGPLSATMTVNL